MRKRFIFMFSITSILCLYLGFDIYTRWRDSRDSGRQLEELKAEQQSQILDAYRGTELKIVSFYAVPGTIRKGQKAQLCYGVIHSEKVRIEPPVENVWPAVSNCVEVRPKTRTVYRLIVEDAKGNAKEADTTVEVK